MTRFVLPCLCLVALSGCATSGGDAGTAPADVVIAIDTAQFAGPGDRLQPRARVDVTDIRHEATLERTALGVSLGRIRLEPPAPELVKAIVEAAAEGVLTGADAAGAPGILCGIRVFDVTTPSTPLYWDIDVKIEIVLRVRGQDRAVTAAATGRTWLWPSAELIGRVTTEALVELADGSRQALATLLAPP